MLWAGLRVAMWITHVGGKICHGLLEKLLSFARKAWEEIYPSTRTTDRRRAGNVAGEKLKDILVAAPMAEQHDCVLAIIKSCSGKPSQKKAPRSAVAAFWGRNVRLIV